MRIIYLLFFIVSATNTFAQQDVQFSQYMFNGLIINPAYAGSKEEISVSAFYKRQWVNMPDGPVAQSFSIHAPVSDKRIGLGLNVLNETILSEKVLTASGCYAYKINLAKGIMSFGISAGIKQFVFDPSSLDAKDKDDPVIAAGRINKLSPDFSAGFYYQKKKYYVGFSVQHLFNNDIGANFTNARHLYLTGAYRIFISDYFTIIPTTLIKYVENAPAQADLTTHLLYQDIGWIGASYRTGDAASIQAGINLDGIIRSLQQRIKIGYAYDLTLSALKSYNGASHEIMLICDFEIPKKYKKLQKKRSTVSPLFF